MLVLTRKTSQVIQLGNDITITVVRTSSGSVRLGIDAPPHIRILRADLIDQEERTGKSLPEVCEVASVKA